MIETEQCVAIDAPIDHVWAIAQDINLWADLMPGLQSCDIVDADRSRWTLKVGAGALVRTVRVDVHVERWAGPHAVDFVYALDGDPAKGGGTYRAKPDGPERTQLSLAVRVEGTGPMAPMWEAMGRPLLPKFARGFAEAFREQVEQAAPPPKQVEAAVAPPCDGATAAPHRLFAWLRRLLGRITGEAG